MQDSIDNKCDPKSLFEKNANAFLRFQIAVLEWIGLCKITVDKIDVGRNVSKQTLYCSS